MNHAEIRVELANRIERLLASDDLPVTLYPFQRETFEHMLAWLRDPNGTRYAYVEHATGLGKTVLFGALIAFCAGLRTLIVVPSKVLIEQTARSLMRFTGGLLGHLSSLDDIQDADGTTIALKGHEYFDVVITTDETLLRHPARIAHDFAPHLIIWDECHWAYKNAARRTLPFFPEAPVIGFSATPDYLTTVAPAKATPVTLENGETLYCQPGRRAEDHFGTCLDRRSARWGIENGWLAPLAWGVIDFKLSLDAVPVDEGAGGLDFQNQALSDLLQANWSDTAQTLGRLYAGNKYGIADHRVFAICPSVATAEELAAACATIGVASACVSGKTSTRARNATLTSFRKGTTRLLTSVFVLREGWDEPNADVCLMLRPTRAYTLYMQTMGRVLRPNPDKVALVLDGRYTETTIAPLSAASLFVPAGTEVTLGDIIVGPRISSPYLPPPKLREKIRVEPITIERWIGVFETFEMRGEQWGADKAVANAVDVSRLRVRHWAERGLVRTFEGLSRARVKTTFYSVADAQREADRVRDDLR
ncbi:MAG: DEAD/DEAH box helicase family protein [bacterium]|nr:DEAD/DEAH box helicase family protein [bacterium]